MIQAQSPESKRLDSAAFREGLRRRGLTDLLELHLSEAPPRDPVQAMLLEREVKLGTFHDASMPQDIRLNALTHANDLLRTLIADHADRPEAFDWRLQLGKSLLYDEAEPYCLQLLYRGGSKNDRAELARLTDEAQLVFDELLEHLDRELERIDQLDLREFERLDRRGHVERIENIIPQAQYMRRWVIYYRALARGRSDPTMASALKAMLRDLVGRSGLLAVSHETSHYQGQSFLLAGLTSRFLGNAAEAIGYLSRAIEIVEAVPGSAERKQLRWAITLARVERVRALSDAGDFDRASRALDEFGAVGQLTGSSRLGLRLTAALLSCDVHQAHADRLQVRGQSGAADRERDEAWQALIELAADVPQERNVIYAIVAARVEPDIDPATLHPFEQCAVLADQLAGAERIGQRLAGLDDQSAESRAARESLAGERGEVLDRTIQAGTIMWRLPPVAGRSELHAEIGYNLGVSLFLRGRRSDAVEQFMSLVKRHEHSSHALGACTLAVKIASELNRESISRTRLEVQGLYLRALEALLDRFGATDEANYWRFFYAQTLDETGRHDEAARQFQRIGPDHEHYLSAVYLNARALSSSLHAYAVDHADKFAELGRWAAAVAREAKRFHELVEQRGAQDDPGMQRLLAHSSLMVGEAYVLPGVGRESQALDQVADFEHRFAALPDLLGRALRVRVIAYAALGRVAEARSVVPQFLQRQPDRAVPTLQALFDRMHEDSASARAAGRERVADEQAEMALVLADELMGWASLPTSNAPAATLYALRLQLAEARVQVGRFAEARVLFDQCLTEEGRSHPDGQPRDLRAVFGMGEALYGLNEFADALDLFARIFQESSVKDRRWWHALLRNLQCRSELGHDPAGIVSAIKQQRFLHPRMGGDHLRGQFEALLRRHEANLSATPPK